MLAVDAHEKLRVLVVDDDVDTVDSTAMVLRLVGHDAISALNGPDAITRASAYEPHIALLDLAMPRMDGYEVARQIQKLSLPRPPVLVAVSGFAHPEARNRAAET